MDSDSDVPLSNYAGTNYLRKEIAKLKKLVAEKTAGVQPSTTSPAAVGRRSVPRISTAGTVHPPAAETSSSAVTAVTPRDVRSLGPWNPFHFPRGSPHAKVPRGTPKVPRGAPAFKMFTPMCRRDRIQLDHIQYFLHTDLRCVVNTYMRRWPHVSWCYHLRFLVNTWIQSGPDGTPFNSF